MTANGYTGNPPGSGGGGGSTAWADITGKPSTFPPSPHTQAASTISDSTTVGRAVLTAADAAAGRTALSAEASGAASAAVAAHVAASDPHTQYLTTAEGNAAYAALNHTHPQSDITSLTADLALKAPLASPALTGNPTAPTQTAGNDSTRLATTAFVTAAVAAGGGGGGGTAPTFARARITSGDLVMPNDAAFTPISGLTLALPAVTGEDVEITLNAMLHSGGGADNFYDLVILVGGAIVNCASSGTNTPATEGDPALYPSTAVLFRGSTTSWGLTLASGDLSGGNVTFGLAHKGPGGGTPKVYASSTYPFRWRARNDH